MSQPRTPLGDREARETSGMTSRLMLAYAERVGGREAVDAVLQRAGMADYEAELRDENTWFSFATKVRLFQALAEVLDDPAATRRAGAGALAGPARLPAGAGGAAGGAGWLAVRAGRARAARWRALEAEVAEQAAVSERLSASLQDLVSELRLEEVLDKVVAHARAAVAGKDFALLVVEDDRLVCRSSTGLPPTSVATLEAWAAQNGALRREDHVLVDDTAAVGALAPLAAHATHALRSLCAAPLVFRGEA